MRYKVFLALYLYAVPSLLANGVEQTEDATLLSAKYQKALSHFIAQKYAKAANLFEELLPTCQGKQMSVESQFYLACCHFYQKNYPSAADQFRRLRVTYPALPQAEEALFREGVALFHTVPYLKRDQQLADEALELLQRYVDQYPSGLYYAQAQTLIQDLQKKLAQKALAIAQLYYHLRHYKAASINLKEVAVNALSKEEQARVLQLKAVTQFRLATTETDEQRTQSLQRAAKYCEEFLRTHTDSKLTKLIKHTQQAIVKAYKPTD